jgi:ribonuclease HII
MTRLLSGSPRPLPLKPDFSEERAALAHGLWPIAGLDEVGRGPLAGPVVAAAVILDPDRLPDGLDDSKRLSAKRREALFREILGSALSVSVASVSAEGIDRGNILQASLEAMCRALDGLTITPLLALVDGRDVPKRLSCQGTPLIGGDRRSQSIAAASIVAKVTRDRMMECCGRHDDRYGFEGHAGYGTPAHRTAITEHGPVGRLHRMSFGSLKDL